MVLVLIGIAVGIIFVAILIIKVAKTSSHDVVGVDMHCRKCGIKISELKCPKCDKRSTVVWRLISVLNYYRYFLSDLIWKSAWMT